MAKKKRRVKRTPQVERSPQARSSQEPLADPSSQPVGRSRTLWIGFVVLVLFAIGWYLRVSPALQLRHAENAMVGWQFENASQLLDDYPSWGPNPGKSCFLRARLIRMQASYAGAIRQLKEARALGFDPDAIDRERVLLDIQNGGASRKLLGQFDRLLEQNPDDRAAVYEVFANGCFLRGESSTAFEMLDRWSRESPNDARPVYWSGVFLDLQKKPADALKMFEQANERNPSFVESYLARGKILSNQKDFEASLLLHREAHRVAPERIDVTVALGQLLWKMRLYEDAFEVLEPIAKASPENFPAGHRVGQYHAMQGRPEKVLSVIEPMRDFFPDEVGLNYLLGSAYYKVGKHEEAKRAMDRFFTANEQLDVLRSTPFDVPLQQQYQEILRRAKAYRKYDRKRSLKWLNLATQSQPDNPEPYQFLSQYYRESGSAGEAMRQQNIGETLASRLE